MIVVDSSGNSEDGEDLLIRFASGVEKIYTDVLDDGKRNQDLDFLIELDSGALLRWRGFWEEGQV